MSRTGPITQYPSNRNALRTLNYLHTGVNMAYRNRGLIRKAGQQLGSAYKRYRSGRANTSRSSGGGAPSTATYQSDAVVIQSRRRRGGRQIRKAKNFKRFRAKVRAVMSSDVPNSLSLRQSFRTISLPLSDIATQAEQRAIAIGWGDSDGMIDQIFSESGSSASLGSEDTVSIKSTACELQIMAQGACFVDVYELVARKNIARTMNADVSAQWSDCFNQLANVGGAPSTNTWGVTPFDAPYFVKLWKVIRTTRLAFQQADQAEGVPGVNNQGIKVLERTMKFGNKRIMGGAPAQYQYLKGMRAFLFVVKGVPITGTNGEMSDAVVSIRFNQTWHYEKFEPFDAARGAIPV